MGFFNFSGFKSKPPAGRLPWPKAAARANAGIFFGNGQFGFRDLISGLRTDIAPIKPEEAGDLSLNPIFAICLGWIGTSWPLAIPLVGRMDGAKFVPDAQPHPVLDLLNKPNPNYTGKWLIWALNKDFWRRGNAYAHIVRMSGAGEPVELDWLPARCVRPVADANGYLDYYEYMPGGAPIKILPENILHFRFGIDEANPLLGEVPLRSGFREFVSDNSASNYQAGLLKNNGMGGLLLSPRIQKGPDGEYTMSVDESKELTAQFQDGIRDEPGKPRFVPAALEVHQLSIQPDKMALNEVREEPETRIPALFQIPPIVLNLRVAQKQTSYNNMKEAKKMAWEGCLIPMQDYFAQEMSNKLLPMYPGTASDRVIGYDRSNVVELQEDNLEKRKAARDDWAAGILTIEEVRGEAGRTTDAAVMNELLEREAAAAADAQRLAEVPTKSVELKKNESLTSFG